MPRRYRANGQNIPVLCRGDNQFTDNRRVAAGTPPEVTPQTRAGTCPWGKMPRFPVALSGPFWESRRWFAGLRKNPL